MTEASSVIMQGITKTRRMLEQNRGVYMALRGGLEEQERDVNTLPPWLFIACKPPLRQPKGNSVASLVNSHTNATSKR